MTTPTPPSPQSAKCPVCEQNILLDAEGSLILHNRPTHRLIGPGFSGYLPTQCPGSGTTPQLFDASGREKRELKVTHPGALDIMDFQPLLDSSGPEKEPSSLSLVFDAEKWMTEYALGFHPLSLEDEQALRNSSAVLTLRIKQIFAGVTSVESDPPAGTPMTDEFLAGLQVNEYQWDELCRYARTLERSKLAAEAERDNWHAEIIAIMSVLEDDADTPENCNPLTGIKVIQSKRDSLTAQLAMANDAAAKGEQARLQAGGMEMEIKELRERLAQANRVLVEIEGGINGYLHVGGLFNPEMMEHDKVGMMLFEFVQIIRSLLPAPPSPTLYCQTCEEGQEFVGLKYVFKELYWPCEKCKQNRIFRPEKPEGKQP